MTCRKMCDLPSVDAIIIDPDTVRIGGSEFKRARTCRDFGGEEGANGEGYDFACGWCGWCGDVTEPRFCPNCGAKAVRE